MAAQVMTPFTLKAHIEAEAAEVVYHIVGGFAQAPDDAQIRLELVPDRAAFDARTTGAVEVALHPLEG